MDKETIETINVLAEKLGQTGETLISYFAVRAPYEFSAFFILISVFTLFVIIARASYKKFKDSTQDDEVLYGLGMVISVFVAFFTGIPAMISLHEAIMAVASPRAYAIESILRLIN